MSRVDFRSDRPGEWWPGPPFAVPASDRPGRSSASMEEYRNRPEPRDNRQRDRSEPRHSEQREQRPYQRSDNYQRPEGPRPTWSPDMVNAAQEWLKETLVLTGLQDANIKSHVSQSFLKLIVDKPVSDDPRQEELLLKSWSNLAYDALQEKFNQPLHGLRLVIEVKRN